MNIEQIKQVLESAPKGATHAEVMTSTSYWDLYKFRLYVWDTKLWEEQYAGIRPANNFYSLSDLRTILAQHEELERLRGALTHLHHNAKSSGAEMGLTLGHADGLLELPKEQSK